MHVSMYLKFVQNLKVILSVPRPFPIKASIIFFTDNLPVYKLNAIFLSYKRVIYSTYGSVPFFA